MARRAFLGGPRRGPWTSLKFFIRGFYYPYQKLLEVQKPSKKQQAMTAFLRFVEQTVFWLIERARAILEMLFSKRFLAAGGRGKIRLTFTRITIKIPYA